MARFDSSPYLDTIMAVALDQFGMASVLTVVVIIVLFGLGFVERKINGIKQQYMNKDK